MPKLRHLAITVLATAALVATTAPAPATAAPLGPLRPALRLIRVWTPGHVTFYGLERWLGHSPAFASSAAIIAARGYHRGPFQAAPRGYVKIVTTN